MKKLKNIFTQTEMVIVTIPLFLLCTLTVVQIIMRTLFKTGIHWLEEFGRYILLYSTFIGAGIAIKSDEHPRMTAIIAILPEKIGYIVKIIGDLICAIILLVLDYYAWIQVINVFVRGTRTSTLPLPMWIVYAILPVAMIIMSVRYLSSAWDKVVLLKDKKRGD